MAPRVAKVTDSMVTAMTRPSTASPHTTAVPAMVRIRSIQPRWSSRLAVGTWFASAWRSAAKFGHAGRKLDDDQARDRQIVEMQAGAEPRLDQLFGFFFRVGADIGDAGRGAR